MGSNPFTSLKRAAVHDSFGDVLPAGNTSSTKMGKFASKRARTAAPDNLVDGVSVVEVDEEPRTFPIGRVSTIEEAWQQWNIPSDALPIPLKDWTTQMISDNPQKMVYYQRRALCKEIERLGSVEIFKTIHGNTLTGAGESVRERNLAEGKSKRRTKKGAKNAQNDDAAAMADVSAADVSTAPANGNYSLYDEDDDDEDDEDERIAASGVMSAPRTSSRQQQRIQQQQQQAPQQSPTTSFIPTTGQANTRQPQQQQHQQQQQQPFATHHHQGYQTSVASHHNHTNTLNSQQAAVAAQSLLNHSRLPGPPTHHGGGSANSGGGSGSASHVSNHQLRSFLREVLTFSHLLWMPTASLRSIVCATAARRSSQCEQLLPRRPSPRAQWLVILARTFRLFLSIVYLFIFSAFVRFVSSPCSSAVARSPFLGCPLRGPWPTVQHQKSCTFPRSGHHCG